MAKDAHDAGASGLRCDRSFLLREEKRSQVMELWEIQRTSPDSFGDSEHQSIYGVPPTEWYARFVSI